MADRDTLLQQLSALIAVGNDESVRKFVKEHFAEFPKDIREQYMAEMLVAALNDANRQRDIALAIEDGGIEMWKQLDEMEKESTDPPQA